MSRLYRRRDRIKEQVQIVQVLAHYGYRVHSENYEQQFPCDLHGDGHDLTPSARVYPSSNSFYCFACDRIRDPIGIVMEKENVEFSKAVRILEERYGLPDIPWEEGDSQTKEEPMSTQVGKQFEEMSHRGTSYEDERQRVEKLLYNSIREKSVSMDTALFGYEAFDRISWSVEKEHSTEDIGREAMIKLRERIRKKMISG